jgi:hypothetical protein
MGSAGNARPEINARSQDQYQTAVSPDGKPDPAQSLAMFMWVLSLTPGVGTFLRN